MTKKTKPTEPVLVRAARLENGVYQGVDELPEDQLTEDHLPRITDCDLPPGKYRWDGEKFVPLPRKSSLTDGDETAIASGLLRLLKLVVSRPDEARATIEKFTKEIEG